MHVINAPCRNCWHLEEDHTNHKCLFAPTMFNGVTRHEVWGALSRSALLNRFYNFIACAKGTDPRREPGFVVSIDYPGVQETTYLELKTLQDEVAVWPR